MATDHRPVTPEAPDDAHGSDEAAAPIEALIEALIPNDLHSEPPAALSELSRLLTALEGQRETSLELARDAAAMMAPGAPEPPMPVTALLSNRLDALRTEGAIQALLGQLPETELAMLQAVLEASAAGTPLAPEYCLASLVLSGHGQRHVQPGVVVLARTEAFENPAPASPCLIYWPGRDGELARFETRQALLDALAQFLAIDGDLQLELLPTLAPLFEQGLEAQLQDAQSRVSTLPMGSPEAREALQRLREELIEAIQVPEAAARTVATLSVQELWRSLALAGNAEASLASLDGSTRAALKHKMLEYLEAASQVERLKHWELPGRDAFAKRCLSKQLHEDFSLTATCEVRLDLPVEVLAVRELISGSGAPGTPYRIVPTPSAAREVVALSDLALENIDDLMEQRLKFMKVELLPADHPQRETLLTGVGRKWIAQTVRQLDVAQQYEDRLYRFFKRTDASTEALEQERGLLRRPFELLFELQAQMAGALGILDGTGQAILAIATHARAPDSWAQGPYRVQILPVLLRLYDERQQHSSANLSGASFVTDAASGVTVLMLAGVPDGKFVSQHPSLAAAQEALAVRCLDEKVAAYIADRAVAGEPSWLKARISQALSAGFKELFTAGNAWPGTTSLAQHLVDSQMGEAIKAHRATSLSNHELTAAKRALAQGEVFDHLKLIMGLVPVLGAGIALVDAGHDLYRAAQSFVTGQPAKGFAYFESTLLSLTDGLMDLLPGIGLSSRLGKVRVVASARQLRRGAERWDKWRQGMPRLSREADRPFQGYGTEVSLAGLRPGVEGRWQGIYQLQGQHYIQRNGIALRTQWDADLRTWRLAPAGTRTYPQAIALDASGQWQTHGTLYGTLVKGGLQGGGGVLGTLADQLDPHLPGLLRQHLPRWFTDAGYRRLQRLKGTCEAAYATFLDQHGVVSRHFDAIRGRPDASQLDALDDVLSTGIMRAQEAYSATGEYLPLSSGRFKRELIDRRHKIAAQVANYSNRRAQLCNERITRSLDASDEAAEAYRLVVLSHTMGSTSRQLYVAQGTNLVQHIRQGRLDRLVYFEQAEQLWETIDRWRRQVSDKAVSKELNTIVRQVVIKYAPHQMDFVRAQHYLSLILIERIEDLSLQALQLQFSRARLNFAANLSNLHHAADLKLGQTQRRAIIEQATQAFATFAKQLKHWEASYPGLIDGQAAQQLEEIVSRIKLRAERKIHDPATSTGNLPVSRKRVLTTVEGHVLIAEPETPAGDIMRASDVDAATRYRKTQGDRWEPVDPPATPATAALNATEIKVEAQKRLRGLASFTQKAEGYARQGMAPADLEDVMLAERNELLARAQRVQALPADPEASMLAGELRQAAGELASRGTAMRIAQIKLTTTPTAGYLDYLLQQRQVRILKVGGLEEITVVGRGRREFLQEYEILDLKTGQALWYAHFHYENSQPTLYDLQVAHLKRPDQRRKGLRWQQGQGEGAERIWRGEIPRAVAFQYFQDL